MKIQKRLERPKDYRPLLTFENAKTIKGEDLGWLTGILYLAPANSAGRGNICAGKSLGCETGCLDTSGLGGVFPSIKKARIAKTLFMFDHYDAFMESLRYDIARLLTRAKKHGLKPAVRINGTSDLPKIAMQLAKEFREVQFYDYTKLDKAWQRTRANYHLTFSRHEKNEALALNALANKVNVAVVFAVKRGKPLPKKWKGVRVIDGDMHDLRFLDKEGVVVGLRAKGKARHDVSGFAVNHGLIQISGLAA